MKKKLIVESLTRIGLWIAFISFGVSVQAASKGILVRPKKGVSMNLQLGYGISATSTFEELQAIQFQSESDKQNFIQDLNPDLYEWEEKVPFTADDTGYIPTDEDFSADPLLANQWSITPSEPQSGGAYASDIDAFRAWTLSTGSAKVVIYVMDSGVDTRDPDLDGRVTSGFNAFNPAIPANDDNGHGTHVTSIIAARGNNSYGIRGVVPGDIQIAAGKFLNGQNQGDSETALRVINWMKKDMRQRRAQDPHVKFIGSNSWGGNQYSQFLEEGMQELTQFGYLPITSAGNHGGNNDSSKYYPCNFKLQANVCVGASDRLDRKTNFSGFGISSVHLFAPGDNIYAIVPGVLSGQSYQSKYESKKGTSQSVPHVAGVAALIWSVNPELSPHQVREILIRSVDRIPGAESFVLSGGRLNAYRALLLATGQDPSKADRGFESNAMGGGGCVLLAGARQESSFYRFLMLISLTLSAFFIIRSDRSKSRSRN